MGFWRGGMGVGEREGLGRSLRVGSHLGGRAGRVRGWIWGKG